LGVLAKPLTQLWKKLHLQLDKCGRHCISTSHASSSHYYSLVIPGFTIPFVVEKKCKSDKGVGRTSEEKTIQLNFLVNQWGHATLDYQHMKKSIRKI
jgi:hypothetical protein